MEQAQFASARDTAERAIVKHLQANVENNDVTCSASSPGSLLAHWSLRREDMWLWAEALIKAAEYGRPASSNCCISRGLDNMFFEACRGCLELSAVLQGTGFLRWNC